MTPLLRLPTNETRMSISQKKMDGPLSLSSQGAFQIECEYGLHIGPFFFMGWMEWILVGGGSLKPLCQHHINFVSGLTMKWAQALYLWALPGHSGHWTGQT